MNETNAVPRLAPPGAGLPWLELKIGRWIFRRQAARSTPADTSRRLLAAKKAALERVAGCNEADGRERVLIARIRGMEDSSRHWSVFMTLDHMRIMNTGVAGILLALGRGRPPERKASTANVKPSPEAGPSAAEAFAESCDAVERAAAKVGDLRTAARYPHPWFGPLDAAGWYFMASFHTELHLRQLDAILRGLPR